MAAIPRSYRLTLEPDLAARRFAGRAVIALEGTADAIALDCVDLDIQSVEASGASAVWRLADGKLTVQAAAASEIAIAYTGSIGETPRGLYGNGEWLLSQMQPTHARRIFPCFDDPAFRCPLELTVIADPGLTVLANAAIRSREGRQVVFEPTPPLPTNLLALAIGPFLSCATEVEGVPLAVHGLANLPSLEAAARALAFNIAWHARPPATGKLDILAAPRLEAAGMENTGAIFLRDSAATLGNAELIAHEIAHQWFGGLIGPAAWRDLWLNEGFATWMAAKTVHACGPDPAFEAAQVRATRAAMAGDVRPLRQDAVTEDQIAERFDTAAYRKGAALLTLLEAWLGEDVFQAGVRRYVAKGGTATAGDLWAALAAESGQPVALVAAPLAERAGVPTLRFSREGDDLVIRQLGEPRVMPVFLKSAAGPRTLLLTAVETRLPLAGWVFGNAGAKGYYRCLQDDAAIPLEALDETEIVTLQEDAWDAMWSGQGDLIGYLRLAERLGAAGRGLDTLGPRLDELADLLAAGPRRTHFEAWIAARAPGVLAPPVDMEALWAKVGGEDLDERIPALEALLADPRSRGIAWARLKAGWDGLGARLTGFGGRGVATAIAAFCDRAELADLQAFFAARPLPGAETALADSFARIAARAAFREAQQGRFDAWLLHQASPGPASPALRTEHARVNALAAALHGALYLRAAYDREGVEAPSWMQSADGLRGVLAAVERVAAQQARGQPCAPPGLADLVRRMEDDLTASATLADRMLGRLTGADPAAPWLVVQLLAREAASREREYQGARTFAALFGDPPPVPPPADEALLAWLTRPAGQPFWRADRLALRNDAALAGANLWARAARLAGQDSLWAAYGIAEPGPWLARGIVDPVQAGEWSLRGFKPGQVVEGADPRALKVVRPPAPAPAPVTRLRLPDGTEIRAETPLDPAARAMGLMHRDGLKSGEAMLFELPDAGPHPFFMRHVRMPLDILWLDGKGRVLHVESNAPAWSEAALPADLSLAAGRWVLELAGGEAAKRGLGVGARVEGLAEGMGP